MAACPVCGSALFGIEPHCRTCNAWIGAPNVLLTKQAAHQAALATRYEQTLSRATARGALAAVRQYQDFARTASAVINCSIDFAYFLFSKESNLHATYYEQVEGGVRAPAQLEHDRQRRAVDALLYGSYASSIHFAALSVDGRGLSSYGPISIRLRDIAIASRATVLEENAFSFIERHRLRPGMELPKGFMAPWPERDIIAVVKVEPLLVAGTNPSLFSSLLLKSGDDRKDDEFVEVHIYGSFSYRAAEKVWGPKTTSKRGERALLKALKELVVLQGALWEDV